MDTQFCKQVKVSTIDYLQDFNSVFVIRKKTLKTIAVSDNTSDYLEYSEKHLLRQPIAQYLPNDAVRKIKKFIRQRTLTKTTLTCEISFEQLFHPVVITAYQDEKNLYLNIEKNILRKEQDVINYYYFHLNETQTHLSQAATYNKLFNYVLRLYQKLTQFDLIMIYQYQEDGSGKVIAERKKQTMPSYLNHFFPADDTPPSVKEAFLTTPIRYIPDVNYTPVQFQTYLKSFTPDLLPNIARGVSPVHVEFLKNMKTASSLSLAIIIKGKLWGLVALHNKKPTSLPVHLRHLLTIITDYFALKLNQLNETEVNKERVKAIQTINQLTKQLTNKTPLANTILKQHHLLKRIIDFDSVYFCFNNESRYIGKLPSKSVMEKLTQIICQTDDKLLVSNNLCQDFNFDPQQMKTMSGALVIILNKKSGSFLVFLRTSVVEEQVWAGNPNERIIYSNQTKTYHPRKSFESWKENNLNQAKKWSTIEIEIAQQLRSIFIEKMLSLQLEQKAFIDPLTQLYNRHYLEDFYLKALSRMKRKKDVLAIIILDIDFFKQVNDDYGHDSGDKLLKQFANFIISHFRDTDLVCRYGGEEFVIILEEIQRDKVIERLEKLRLACEKKRFKLGKRQIKITFSGGGFLFSPHRNDHSLQAAIKAADEQLYEAKERGRNRICI